MALKALQQEAVQPTLESLLAFLDRDELSVPGSQVEAIVSGKSLLRALIAGQLVLAQQEQLQQPQAAPVAEEEVAEEAA